MLNVLFPRPFVVTRAHTLAPSWRHLPGSCTSQDISLLQRVGMSIV
jgi:hypothetical protein